MEQEKCREEEERKRAEEWQQIAEEERLRAEEEERKRAEEWTQIAEEERLRAEEGERRQVEEWRQIAEEGRSLRAGGDGGASGGESRRRRTNDHDEAGQHHHQHDEASDEAEKAPTKKGGVVPGDCDVVDVSSNDCQEPEKTKTVKSRPSSKEPLLEGTTVETLLEGVVQGERGDADGVTRRAEGGDPASQSRRSKEQRKKSRPSSKPLIIEETTDPARRSRSTLLEKTKKTEVSADLEEGVEGAGGSGGHGERQRHDNDNVIPGAARVRTSEKQIISKDIIHQLRRLIEEGDGSSLPIYLDTLEKSLSPKISTQAGAGVDNAGRNGKKNRQDMTNKEKVTDDATDQPENPSSSTSVAMVRRDIFSTQEDLLVLLVVR